MGPPIFYLRCRLVSMKPIKLKEFSRVKFTAKKFKYVIEIKLKSYVSVFNSSFDHKYELSTVKI